MNHVNALTGTVLGGVAMCQHTENAHGADESWDEGALAAFLSSLAPHGAVRHPAFMEAVP